MRYFLAILLLFLSVVPASSSDEIIFLSGSPPAASGGGCSVTPSYSQTSIGFDTEYWAAYDFVGAKYSSTTSYDVCSIKYYVSVIVGNLSSETIYAQVYSLSGTSLNTLLGQKQLVSTSITTGWNTVTFDSPIATGTSGFAIVLTKSSGETNYIKYGFTGNVSGDWNTGAWYANKSIERDLSGDFAIEIFE